MRTLAAAGIAAAALALGVAAAAARAPVQAPADDGRVLGRFLFFATFEGLCEDGLPDRSVAAVLEQDEQGRYRNFVYACPVCSPVLEGFRAYALREKFYYSRKGDPLAGDPSPAVAAVVEGLASPESVKRGAALDAFVRRCVERRMEHLRLREEERQGMRIRLEEGRKKGMEVMRHSEGFQFKSCPSCDGANGEDWKDK